LHVELCPKKVAPAKIFTTHLFQVLLFFCLISN